MAQGVTWAGRPKELRTAHTEGIVLLPVRLWGHPCSTQVAQRDAEHLAQGQEPYMGVAVPVTCRSHCSNTRISARLPSPSTNLEPCFRAP